MSNIDELARSYSFEIRRNQDSMENQTPTVRYPTYYRQENLFDKLPARSSSINVLMNSSINTHDYSLTNRKVIRLIVFFFYRFCTSFIYLCRLINV